ncbi:MAG: hypothetical protein IH908_13775 [Proteobacteria bacterium]|nr:hypothetical protein [Pseudomonadota bacterium]
MHKKTAKSLTGSAWRWIRKPFSAVERKRRDAIKRLPLYRLMIVALLGVFAFHPKVYAQG